MPHLQPAYFMTGASGKAQQNTLAYAPPELNCVIDCADYSKFLGGLPAQSVDLILTDPPYAISRKTGFASIGEKSVERFAVSMEFGKWDEEEIDLRKFAEQAYRALKKSGTAIVFYDLWKFNHLAAAMAEAGFKQLRLIIWEKSNPVPLNSKRNYLTNSREIAVLGVRNGTPTFHGEYDNGVYSYPIPNNGKRHHPTQKPLPLMIDLIEKHSNKGDLVIDPFLGSGTTALGAVRTGRQFAGCDISKKYANVARGRVKDSAG